VDWIFADWYTVDMSLVHLHMSGVSWIFADWYRYLSGTPGQWTCLVMTGFLLTSTCTYIGESVTPRHV
jgi:hypothetical protein